MAGFGHNYGLGLSYPLKPLTAPSYPPKLPKVPWLPLYTRFTCSGSDPGIAGWVVTNTRSPPGLTSSRTSWQHLLG